MGLPKIVVVDDDQEVLQLIRDYLNRENYHVMCLGGERQIVKKIKEEEPDLIIMDTLLKEKDGIELCYQLRKYTDAPILFVSAKCEDVDKVVGLSAGGDDYIGKPFSPIELVARVKAHLRRNHMLQRMNATRNHVLKFGDLHINLANQIVQLDEDNLPLSAREFKLLTQLAQHPGRVYSMDELYELVWETRNVVDVRTVMVHISNLRKKLKIRENSPSYILTVRGVGYKFNENVQ